MGFIFQTDLNAENKSPFNWSHIHDLIDACYTKQTGINRAKISIIMMIVTLSLIQISGRPAVIAQAFYIQYFYDR